MRNIEQLIRVVDHKKEMLDCVKELAVSLANDLDYIERSKHIKNKDELRKKAIIKTVKLANEIVKDLEFVLEDFSIKTLENAEDTI